MTARIKIYLLACIVFMFKWNNTSGQINIYGKITDTTGRPIRGVSVTLNNKINLVIGFSITGADGGYRIKQDSASGEDSLYISMVAVGYLTKKILIRENQGMLNAVLQFSVTSLPDVKVRNTAPLLRKEGDTLNYDVASFSNPQDRVIGDVIKRLPGVEVDENGKISYQGKPINRFYIDGDNLLDDKYNIATKSVPNDMVSKIQVLENHEPIKALKKVSRSTDAAINLVMKEKARFHMIGNGDLTVGSPSLHSENAYLMLFRPNVKFINYYSGNNTGIDLSRDIISHNQGPMQSPPDLTGVSTVGLPPLEKKRVMMNNTVMGNLNIMHTLKNKMQVRLNTAYLQDKQYRWGDTRTDFFLPADTITFTENQYNRLTKRPFRIQLNLNQNHESYYLNSNLSTELTNRYDHASLLSSANTNLINQDFTGQISSFIHDIQYTRVIQRKNVLEGTSSLMLVKNPSALIIRPGLYENVLNNGSSYAGLLQNTSIPTLQMNQQIGLRKASSRFLQAYKLVFDYQSKTLESSLLKDNFNTGTTFIADSFINRFTWKQMKWTVKADYTWLNPKWELYLSLPLNFQHAQYHGRMNNTGINIVPFTPMIQMLIKTGKEATLTMRLTRNNSIGNIDNVYDAYIMKSYRNFSVNAGILPQTNSNNASLNYEYKNTLKIFFANIGISYSHIQANTISYINISSLLQQSNIIDYRNSYSAGQLLLGLSKYMFSLRTTLATKIVMQNSGANQLQNGSLLRYNNHSTKLMVSINTKLNRKINFSLKTNGLFYKSSTNAGKTGVTMPSVSIQQWQHQFDCNLMITDDLSLKLNGEYYDNSSPYNPAATFFFADAGMVFKLNKLNTDIDLTIQNIGGVENYSLFTLSSNSLFNGSYVIRPRMVMLKTSFRF